MNKQTQTKQDTETVISLFENQLNHYSRHDEKIFSPILVFLNQYFQKLDKIPHSICEFGGGGGDLLRAIQQLSKTKLSLTNAELVTAYKKKQALPEINFITQSILDPKLDDGSFDIVVVRNVIHHLIGNTLSQTRKNQQHAIEELARVTKSGGLVLIDEQVNNSPIACSIFYYLSKLASKIGLSINKYQITPNTVIAYLTRVELQTMAAQTISKHNWVSDLFEQWDMPWHWRITMLMNSTGSAFIAMKKP